MGKESGRLPTKIVNPKIMLTCGRHKQTTVRDYPSHSNREWISHNRFGI